MSLRVGCFYWTTDSFFDLQFYENILSSDNIVPQNWLFQSFFTKILYFKFGF